MSNEAKGGTLKDVVAGICWSYRVQDDGTVEIVGKPSPQPAGKFEIPAQLGGRAVTRIGDAVLNDCKELTSVTIPEGVVALEWEVFYGCKMLETVVFPASLTELGRHAFCRCPKLRSFKIPQDNPTYVFEDGFLLTKDRKRLVRCVDREGVVTIPAGVEEIDNGAFSGCAGLTSVTLPDGVRVIWDDAFEFCGSLTELTLPRSLMGFGYDVFYGSKNLKTLRVAPGDAERIRELLEEWSSVDVNLNYVFDET